MQLSPNSAKVSKVISQSKNRNSSNMKAKNLIKTIKVKPISRLSLEKLPENLAISIEQAELEIYCTQGLDITQSKLIIDRLVNIVNTLEKDIEHQKTKTKL